MIVRHTTNRLLPVLVAVVALTAAACGNGSGDDIAPGGTAAQGQLSASVASYDLAAGPPARFVVGVFDNERGPVGHGTVQLHFFFLGETAATGEPETGPVVTARYLPLPDSPPPPADATRARFLPPAERGVYSAEVAFDRPGFWGVNVAVELDSPEVAQAAFQVLPEHQVPFPGDAAIPSENLTIHTPGAPLEAIDSRAREGQPVPHPEIHDTTVAEAMAAGRPILLVISTPTFCVSQFCGPITDMVAELAADYGDRAAFIHIEVWKDFEAQEMNEAAKEWIARGPNVQEPWVFLIDAGGKVTARWDNVATRGEIEPLLQQLPAGAG